MPSHAQIPLAWSNVSRTTEDAETLGALLLAAQASIESIDAQIDVQQAQVALNAAQIQQQQAGLTYAEEQSARYETLARDGWGTVENAQQWVSQQRQGKASVKSAQQALVAAQRRLAVLKAQRDTAEATLQGRLPSAIRPNSTCPTPRFARRWTA